MIGLLSDLWHESQLEEKTEADGADICNWARLDELLAFFDSRELQAIDGPEFIQALVAAEFLEELQPVCEAYKSGFYRIRGNEEQLTAIRKHREKTDQARRNGGEKRAGNAQRDGHGRFTPAEPADDQHPPAGDQLPPAGQNSSPAGTSSLQRVQLQYNAIQCNSIQDNTMQLDLGGGSEPPGEKVPEVVGVEIVPDKKPREPNDVWKVWVSYSDAYEQRWGHKPKQNPKQLAHCRDLVKRLGKDEAIDVAKFFLSHRFHGYVSAKHPLNLLIRDAERVFSDWMTNNASADYARPKTWAERNADANRELYQKVERGEV